MVTKTSAQSEGFNNQALGSNPVRLVTETFSFKDIYIKESDLELSSKQLSKIHSDVEKKIKRQNYISQNSKGYASNDSRETITNREIENKKRKEFLKVNTLFEVGQLELDNIRNNFPNKEYELKEFEYNLKVLIRQEYNDQLKYQGFTKELPENLTRKFLLGYLWHDKTDIHRDSYKQYKKKLRNIHFIENNLSWAESYLSLFRATKQVIYLQTAVNILKSANQKRIVLRAESGFTNSSSIYFSRNRFCAYSQEFKTIQNEKQILETLNYWDKKGYTADFLTLAPKNLHNLDKDDFLSFGKILKEFFRDKEIESKFYGHYGFLEIKEKQNLEFNVHIHLLVLRKKGQFDDKLKYKLSKHFLKHCNNSNNVKFHGSKIIDYQEITNLINNKDVYKGAVRYIHQYITKGIEINSQEARKQIIQCTDGIRFLRSGGLLSLNNQKNIATENEILNSLEQRQQLENDGFFFNFPLSLGGNDKAKPVSYDSYVFDRFLGFSNSDIISKLRKQKTLWKEIKNSIFAVDKQFCPFSNKPLLFSKTGDRKTKTNWKEPLFILEALDLIGLKEESKNYQLKSGFPDDFNIIYKNDDLPLGYEGVLN